MSQKIIISLNYNFSNKCRKISEAVFKLDFFFFLLETDFDPKPDKKNKSTNME